MATDVRFGLRTVSRVGVFRQATVLGNIVLFPFPLIVAPTEILINPNESFEDLLGKNCAGEQVVEFTYNQGTNTELTMNFSTGLPELDSFVHGRLMASQSNVNGFVFFEVDANTVSFPARASGEVGFDVVAQTVGSAAQVYYTNPDTKLAQKIEIVDVLSTPTGDQMIIDDSLAITFSPEIAATGRTVRGWVPCTFTAATVATAEILGLVSVYAQGVDFNNRFAGLIARNCSRIAAGAIGSTAERQINLKVLPDPNDGNGLGYIFQYTNQRVVC